MGRNVNFVDKFTNHECPAFRQECHKCKKKNHWASCCMTKKVHKASTKSDDNFLLETVEAELKEKSTEALAILKTNNKKMKVKLETDAEVNVVLMRVFKQIEEQKQSSVDMVEEIFQEEERSR